MRRRHVILTAGFAGLFPPLAAAARADRLKPQVDDCLVHAFGQRQGKLLLPEEVGEDRCFAFPRSPEGVVRSASLLNQVTVLRIDATAMSERTRRYATGPFVALSAACTHTGCEVSGWHPDAHELECPCHGSRFDVLDAARVVNGPATKPLALLPIALEDGGFRVTGSFSRRVGPEPAY